MGKIKLIENLKFEELSSQKLETVIGGWSVSGAVSAVGDAVGSFFDGLTNAWRH